MLYQCLLLSVYESKALQYEPPSLKMRHTSTHVRQRHRRCLIIITITTTLRTVWTKTSKVQRPSQCRLQISVYAYSIQCNESTHIAISPIQQRAVKSSRIRSHWKLSANIGAGDEASSAFEIKWGGQNATNVRVTESKQAAVRTLYAHCMVRWPRILYDGLCASVYWCLVTHFQFSYLFHKHITPQQRHGKRIGCTASAYDDRLLL